MSGEAQSQQQEIITVDDHQHMSIDELLKVIKGANGMPVLFVPSNDGRLAAVAVDGLQNLVPTKHDGFAEKNKNEFRAWLLLLTSLIATVTFTAGLAPPGGFWSADDKANGYIAGTAVMSSKFRKRYLIFYYSNTTAFLTSLVVIGILSKNKGITMQNNNGLRTFACLCFLGLATSYIAGTSVNATQATYPIALFVYLTAYILFPWFLDWIRPNRRAIPTTGQIVTTNTP